MINITSKMTAVDLAKLHLHWRVSKYKDCCYRSYSLARAYRDNGKNRKEIIIKLGKLADAEAEKWRNLLRALKKPDAFLTTLNDIIVTRHFAYLDVCAANAIWDEWELDKIFYKDGKRSLGIAAIARILTLNRSIDPLAKSQTPEWFCSTALPWMLDITPSLVNSSRIFRELAAIEDHKENICKHLFKKIIDNDPDSMKSVFYDLSSTTFTGSRCVLMKWGHCKEGYYNHIVLALVVNSKGLPFYWEVLPGGTADSKTVTWLLERLKKRFKEINTTLVFDRGMVSDNNLANVEDANIKYISAMDRSQLERITGIDFTSFSYLQPDNIDEQADSLQDFTKRNSDTYYREIKVIDKRRYILCFNPTLFKDQRRARKQRVDGFRAFVKELNAELLTAKKSRKRKATYNKIGEKLVKAKLDNFIDVKLRIKHIKTSAANNPIRTYQATVVVDNDAIRQTQKLDGFWLLVTNHTEKENDKFKISAAEAISPYREKVIIEAAFRDIKSFVEIEPVYVWTELHVKAHYSICVLSYLINRTLTLRLHNNQGKITKKIVSHEKLYKKLSDCLIDYLEVENVQKSNYSITRITAEQKELLERVGLSSLLSSDVLKKASSKAIA